MRRGLAIAVALGIAVLAGCSASTEIEATRQPAAASDQEAQVAAPGRCRSDDTFRARLVEVDAATAEVMTEYRYEVGATHTRDEIAGGGRGRVVLPDAGQAWSVTDGAWLALPAVPRRPLRTPWVNNFVTGEAVARAANGSVDETLYGLAVQRVELTYEQFRDAFPDRIGDTDYDAAGTSFTYWLDRCDEIVRAEVVTTFGPETIEFMGEDFPVTLSYLYESYDFGQAFPTVVPESPLMPIPHPSDS